MVCVPSFSGSIKRLYNTLNTAIGFMLNAKDFQLTNFSEKAAFKSYTVFARFHDTATMHSVTLLVCSLSRSTTLFHVRKYITSLCLTSKKYGVAVYFSIIANNIALDCVSPIVLFMPH